MPKYIAYTIVETDKLTSLKDNPKLKELSEYGLTILHSDYFQKVIKAELEADIKLKCSCDCDCTKESDREGEQCDDCDNGTHWDEIRHKYVNYDDERLMV